MYFLQKTNHFDQKACISIVKPIKTKVKPKKTLYRTKKTNKTNKTKAFQYSQSFSILLGTFRGHFAILYPFRCLPPERCNTVRHLSPDLCNIVDYIFIYYIFISYLFIQPLTHIPLGRGYGCLLCCVVACLGCNILTT